MIMLSFIDNLQDLTDRFRYDYSKLWLSILNVDREGMRAHSLNLGIKRDLYPLFACMLTGRPWESVMSGVDKTRHSDAEVSLLLCEEQQRYVTTSVNFFVQKELLQSTTSFVLPNISDILEQVDRQMLLVLKTNDLIRGIESSLGTQNRMTSFWVMAKCCVRSVCRQDDRATVSKWQHYRMRMFEHWSILKLDMYYLWLGFLNFSLLSTVKQLL